MGICMVGLASVLSGEGSPTHAVSTGDMLLGMGLIVASQARLMQLPPSSASRRSSAECRRPATPALIITVMQCNKSDAPDRVWHMQYRIPFDATGRAPMASTDLQAS